jgi:hypothetical protein
MSLCSLQGKSFQALLNGLARKNYYNNKDITNEYLAEELFQQSLATVSVEISAVEEVPLLSLNCALPFIDCQCIPILQHNTIRHNTTDTSEGCERELGCIEARYVVSRALFSPGTDEDLRGVLDQREGEGRIRHTQTQTDTDRHRQTQTQTDRHS